MKETNNDMAKAPLEVGVKTLFLVRHAKSDWSNQGLQDFDRPLNERGKRDAPLMARRLLDKKITIDAFIASPAKRAAKTAILFAREFDRKKEDIIFYEELYPGTVDAFFDVIGKTNDRFESIAVFAHNPDITDFANLLTNTRIDDMPTCSLFAVKIKTKHWKDFKDAEKEFWFFDYPKSGL